MTLISVRLRAAVWASAAVAMLGSYTAVVAATPVAADSAHTGVTTPPPQPTSHATTAPSAHVPATGSPATRNSPPPYQLNLGYADTLRGNPANFPTPWNGAPNVVYEGCASPCTLDSSAMELVNTSSSTLTVNSVVLSFGGSCVYDIWPHTVSLPANHQMVITENTGGGPGGCTVSTGQIDGSDIGPTGQNWAGNCTQSGVIPQITVTVGGVAQVYNDSGQVLNTGGIDGASCNPSTSNESTQWTPAGQTPCSGLVFNTHPFVQALAPGATAGVSTVVSNGCGNPLSGVPVDFNVTSGPNMGTHATVTTSASGKATFSYGSSLMGIDYVQPSVTNFTGTITGSTVRVTWETATLTLGTANALPGSKVTFTGTGYGNAESVTLHYNSTGGQSLVTVTSTSGGAISGTFTVPVGNGVVVNSVVALGATSLKQGWAPFATGCTDDWLNATSGNWNTPSAWTTGAVPTTADLACIVLPGTYTVTMNTSHTVAGLIVGNTVTGTQTLNVLSEAAGATQLTVTGVALTRPTGVLTLDSFNSNNWSMLSGGQFTNDGTFSTVRHAGGIRYLRTNITNDPGGTISIGTSDTRLDNGNILTNKGTFVVAAGSAFSVASNPNSQFIQAGGTLTNNGSLSMYNATWTQSGGALSGNPVNLQSTTFNDSAGTGSFILQCGNNLGGTIPAGQTVSVQANACGGAIATLLGTVTNSGTLALDSLSARSSTTLSGGTLKNNGMFATHQGSGNIRYIRSNVTNNAGGTVSIGAADTRIDSGNILTNNGALVVTATGALSISSNGNSQVIQSGGTLTNNGSLFMYNATWTQSGGTSSGNAVVLQASTINDSAGGAGFLIQCGVTLAGSIPASQTITVQANACGAAAVYLSGVVTNAGALILDSLSADDGSYLATAGGGGSLVNNGTFSAIQDAGGIRYIRSTITNNPGGTVSIGAVDTRLDSGNILTNNGTFTVTGSGGLSIASNPNSQFIQSGGTLTNNGSLSTYNASWTQSGGTSSGNAVILQSTTLTDSAGAASFLLQCSNTVGGTIPATQTITVQANACGSAVTYLTGAVINQGTLVIDSQSADDYSGLFQPGGGSLTNDGTLSIPAAYGGTRYIRVPVTNDAGHTITVGAGDTRIDSNTSLTNNGTVNVLLGGNLSFCCGSTYSQGASATLGVTVDAGTGMGFGLSGTGITVAGNLAVTSANGTPASGTVIQVIFNQVTGTFSSVTAGYTPAYSASGVTVTKN